MDPAIKTNYVSVEITLRDQISKLEVKLEKAKRRKTINKFVVCRLERDLNEHKTILSKIEDWPNI